MTALQSYMFEEDDLARSPTRRGAFSLSSILSCLFVAGMFMLATNDPSATSRWEGVSREQVASLSINMESGRAARQLAFLLLGTGGLITFLFSRRTFRLNGIFLYPLIVLVILALSSVIWSSDRGFTAKRLIVFSCIALAVVSFVRQFHLRHLALMAFLGCGIQLAASIVFDVMYATGEYGRSGYRFSGLQHPNHSGISAMLFIFGTLYFFDRTRQLRYLFLLGGAAMLMYLTKSRTSLIAGIVAISVFGALRWERRTLITLAICGSIMVGAFFMLVATGLVADDWSNVIHMGREDSQAAAFTGRPFIWAAALEWLGNDFSRLLLGAGYDSFWTPEAASFVSGRVWFRISEGHCAYFDMLLEMGIVGVACYVFLLLASLFRYAYLARVKSSSSLAFAAMILVFAVVHGITESTTVDPNFPTFFGFTAMTFLALRHPKVQIDESEVIEWKLLIIVGDFPPFVSGIGDYTDLLARSLTQRGVDVTVLTLVGKDDGVQRPYRVRREMPDFTMKHIGTASDIASQFDVVNIQYPGVHYGRSPMMNLLPAFMRRKAPLVKTTVTIHDCRVMRWRWRLRTWPMVNSVSGIIHVDPGDWPYIKSWCTFGAPPHACIPIASNVDVLPVTPALREGWRAGLGILPDETAIAYFGILYPHKGVDELLTAHAALRRKGHKLRTVIVGQFDREEPWCAPLRERFKEEGVVWVPDANLTRVSECLHACDLSALPFHSGTSTNRSSMLAALGHGLPTVTTNGPATPKEIGDLFDLVLVPPNDPVALEAGIETVLKDAALRERLRSNAVKAKARTTWHGAAQGHLAFFEKLLGRTAQPEVMCES